MYISHFIRFCQIVLQVIVHVLFWSDWLHGLCIPWIIYHPISGLCCVWSPHYIAGAAGGSRPVVRKVLGRDQRPDILNCAFAPHNCGIIDSK